MFVPGYLLLGQSSFVLSSLFAAFYLTPIGNGLFDVHGIYSYTWTLSLEEYFYLAFPVILVYMIRRRLSRRQMVWLLSGTSGLLLITMGVAGLGQFGKPIGLIDLFSDCWNAESTCWIQSYFGRPRNRSNSFGNLVPSCTSISPFSISAMARFRGCHLLRNLPLAWDFAGAGGDCR